MKQTRCLSMLEATFSTGIGLGVSFVANMTVLPLFGFAVARQRLACCVFHSDIDGAFVLRATIV